MTTSNDKYALAAEYIKKSWQKAVVSPEETSCPELYVAPFVPPCVNGDFRVLFYWDTFFTNAGLIEDGYVGLAVNNADNLIFAVNKKGFVPNALSDTGAKWCSQPPYLHFIVRDIYERTKDEQWLKKAYFALKKEYLFWQSKRMTDIGLNRYFHLPLREKDLVDYYDYVAEERLKLPLDISSENKIRLAENYIASAESGLDFSPRFFDFCAEVIPVCLNANLYGLEKDLCEWSQKFEPEKAEEYFAALSVRKALMDEYCLGSDGLYYDYDLKTRKKRRFYSSGQFMPFYTGLSDDAKAVKKLLAFLEGAHGVYSTERCEAGDVTYQWAYPNTWAPDNYICVKSLEKCGLYADAGRIAEKFVENVSSTFARTGRLWEKYDGELGGVAENNEYSITEMLGWTGGVYTVFYNGYLK